MPPIIITERQVWSLESREFPMGSVAIVKGDNVGFDLAGYLVLVTAAATVVSIGIADDTLDNSGGDPGDLWMGVTLSKTSKIFPLDNSGTDPCDQSCVGHDVFVGTSATNARKTSNGGTSARLGKCWGLTRDGKVLVEFDVDADASDIAALEARVTTAEGDIDALEGRADALEADVSTLISTESLYVDEFTDPAAAGAATLKVATASVAAPTTYTQAGGDFPVAGGIAALDSVPRRLRITVAGATPADAPASGTWSGIDANGDPISEAVAIPQVAGFVDTVGFYTGTGLQIGLDAADGVGATLAFGFTDALGLREEVKLRAGLPAVFHPEIAAGAYATNGTWEDPSAAPPNGSYTPSSAPDGSRDYCVRYERVL